MRQVESTEKGCKISPTVFKGSSRKLLEIQLNGSVKGFGCQSDRFQNSATEIPGPSYYYDESRSSLERTSPSLSSKGYSNGFLSGDFNREEFLGLKNRLPGTYPGQYHLPRAMDYSQKTTNRKGGSLPFLLGSGAKKSSSSHRSKSPEAGEELEGIYSYAEEATRWIKQIRREKKELNKYEQ